MDMIWEDYDMSWEMTPRRPEPSLFDIKIMMPAEAVNMIRQYASLSSMVTDKEIVVPPGTPESQIPSPARGCADERRRHENFI